MTARLEARDLAIGYGAAALAVGIDLTLGRGSVTCLMGPNGVGKTTLFKTLLGLLPPHAGTVLICGDDIAGLSREAVATRIAAVPQAYHGDLGHTVLDVVVMGRTARLGLFGSPGRHDFAVALRALETLGIADLAGHSADRISGGQRQMVLIARALAQETGVVVMDEPTASLDLGNRIVVLERIRALADAGLALLVATHDPEQAFEIADRVAVLGRDRPFEVGPVADVLTAGRLSDLYGLDLDIETTPSGRHVVTRRADLATQRSAT